MIVTYDRQNMFIIQATDRQIVKQCCNLFATPFSRKLQVFKY